MALPAPTTPDCDPTVAWLSQRDAAGTFPRYCFNLRGVDAETQAAPTTLGYDSTAAPRSDWGAEPYATEPFPPYNFDASWNMAENWNDLNNCVLLNANFASWPYCGGTGEVVSIKPSQKSAKETATGLVQDQEGDPIIRESQEPPCSEGSKSIEDSATTGESESLEIWESPKELDWPEELELTENSKSPNEPRPFEVPVGVARNKIELLDGEEPVATTEISSDQSKDSYESHGFTSLSNSMYLPAYLVQN